MEIAVTIKGRCISIIYDLFLSFDDIGRSLRTRKHSIGFVVVGEAFGFWVPIYLSFQLHYDMMDQAGGTGTVCDLGIRNGRFPGCDGVQPVAVMIVADIQVGLTRSRAFTPLASGTGSLAVAR
jgi:hypothetical protein